MTVKQLKQELENLPDNMDVFLAGRKTEFGYGLVNSVYTKEVFLQKMKILLKMKLIKHQ